MIALGIVIVCALAVYFFTVRIAPGIFAGMMTATVVISNTSYIASFREGFTTQESRGYVTIALFFGITAVTALLIQRYNSGRRFHGSVGRIIFAAVFGLVFGSLSIILLRSVLDVREVLAIPEQFGVIFTHPYSFIGLIAASALALYVGKGR